jgi:hypothetical protein
MKIVVNTCYGGFGLSEKAEAEFRQAKHLPEDCWLGRLDDYRNDLILVAMVEADAESVSGDHAELEIIEIPDDVDWEIEEYDGIEWVAEVHRTWH